MGKTLEQGYVYIKSTVTKVSIEIAFDLFDRNQNAITHNTNSCKHANR